MLKTFSKGVLSSARATLSNISPGSTGILAETLIDVAVVIITPC
ncbi:hypothetical protein SPONL_1917 [uncultured Candidatus Thioglobus sp.]|nr:hypothetical protein SPONL_1917 [uncultured Candidatus Thioglobus sp.]